VTCITLIFDQVTFSYVITVYSCVILTKATLSQAKKEPFYSFSKILHHQQPNIAISTRWGQSKALESCTEFNPESDLCEVFTSTSNATSRM
jgi:hypothetical protein